MRSAFPFPGGAPRPGSRRLAAVVGAAALPWLFTGDPGACLLGIAALLAACAVVFMPKLGQSLMSACGAVVALLVAAKPLFAGSWSPAGAPEWSIASLIWLPCLLMAVDRGWGIQNCRDFLQEE